MADERMQQQGSHQHDRAEDQSSCTVAVVAPVGTVAVVPETTVHLGSRVAAVSLVTEGLVSARLHHGIYKRAWRRGKADVHS